MKPSLACALLLAACAVRVEPPDDDCLTALPPSCGPTEMHVFAIHETLEPHLGLAQLVIDRPGAHRIVLSAHEPTHWIIELRHPGATLAGVHLVGFSAQTIDLPASIPVTHDAHEGMCFDFTRPFGDGDCSTDTALEVAEDRAQARWTSLHGCYRANTFKLNADGTAFSDCAGDEPHQRYEGYGECPAADTCTGEI